jgi:mannose-6-phosphate isomerase-like protein (cupin superfamily)
LLLCPTVGWSQSSELGPPQPADTSAFRGNVFNLQKQQPLPYEQDFASAPLARNETQSANLVQVRNKLNLHYHMQHDEMVYIVSGRGIMMVGGELRSIQPGDVISIPHGVSHSVECRSQEPLVALSIMSPPFDGKDRIFVE